MSLIKLVFNDTWTRKFIFEADSYHIPRTRETVTFNGKTYLVDNVEYAFEPFNNPSGLSMVQIEMHGLGER